MKSKKILKKFVAGVLAIVITFGALTIIPTFAYADSDIEVKWYLNPPVGAQSSLSGTSDYFVDQTLTISTVAGAFQNFTMLESSKDFNDVTEVKLNVKDLNNNEIYKSVNSNEEDKYIDKNVTQNGDKWDLGISIEKEIDFTIHRETSFYFEAVLTWKDGTFDTVNLMSKEFPNYPVYNYVISLEPDESNPTSTTVNTDTSFKFTVEDGIGKLKYNKNYSSKIALYDENGNKLSDEKNFELDSNDNLTATVNCKFSEIGTYTLIPKIQDNYEGAVLYSFDGFNITVVAINGFKLDKNNIATGASTGVTAILDTNGNQMTNDELIGDTFKLVAVPLDNNGNENWNGNWTIAVDTFTFTEELACKGLANIIRYYPREEGRYRLHLNVQYKDQVGTDQYIDFTQNINCIKNAHHGTDWEYTGIKVNSISATGDSINIEPLVFSYYPQDENNMDYKYIVKPGKEGEGWKGWYVAKPFTTGLNNYDLKLNPGTYTIYIDVKDAFGNVVTQHQEITITEANGAYWCYAGILTGSPVAGSGGNIYITTTPQVVCSNEDVKLQYKYVVKPGRKNDGWKGWYVAQELGDNDSCDVEISSATQEKYGKTYTIYVDVVDSESNIVTQTTEVYLNY